MRKFFAVLLAGLLALAPAAAWASERVVMAPAEQVFGTRDNLLKLYVLDLVGADCMLLTDGRQHLLIDAGKANQHPRLAALLKHLDITSLSLFNTHPHGDHAGGVIPLMDLLDIEVFYTVFPEQMSGRDMVQKPVLAALRDKGVPVKQLRPLDLVPFDGADIRILQWEKGKNINDQSALLHIRYGDATMLLTADISSNGQKFFSNMPELAADIIKAPHHGVEMLRYDFLDTINPAYVFFTHYKTENPKTWQRLVGRKIPHHFANQGIIVLATDGTRWSAEQIGKSMELQTGE